MGLQSIATNPIDFLLVDIYLTKDCNVEVIEIIKNVAKVIDSEIVMLTENFSNKLIQKVIQYGAVAYEQKLRFEKLPRIMGHVLKVLFVRKFSSII